jgi:hypothetical protein
VRRIANVENNLQNMGSTNPNLFPDEVVNNLQRSFALMQKLLMQLLKTVLGS